MNPAASPPISRRDNRKHDRRSAIVSAAKDAFLRNGYAGMSMSGLIETLGGSKATLWRHFRSKEDLFAAVLEDVVGDYGRALAERLLLSDDLRRGLVDFCKDIIAKMISDEGLVIFRLITAEGGRFPEVGKLFYAQAAGPVEASLAAYLRRHMDNGAIIQDDPQRMARTLIDLCHGLQQRRLWGLEILNAKDIKIEATRIADVFLRAFGAPVTPQSR